MKGVVILSDDNNMAFNLCVSIKMSDPRINITLIHNKALELSTIEQHYFNNIIYNKGNKFDIIANIYNIVQYDEILIIDSCYLMFNNKVISNLFQNLQKYDFYLDYHRGVIPKIFESAYIDNWKNFDFGFMYFKNNHIISNAVKNNTLSFDLSLQLELNLNCKYDNNINTFLQSDSILSLSEIYDKYYGLKIINTKIANELVKKLLSFYQSKLNLINEFSSTILVNPYQSVKIQKISTIGIALLTISMDCIENNIKNPYIKKIIYFGENIITMDKVISIQENYSKYSELLLWANMNLIGETCIICLGVQYNNSIKDIIQSSLETNIIALTHYTGGTIYNNPLCITSIAFLSPIKNPDKYSYDINLMYSGAKFIYDAQEDNYTIHNISKAIISYGDNYSYNKYIYGNVLSIDWTSSIYKPNKIEKKFIDYKVVDWIKPYLNGVIVEVGNSKLLNQVSNKIICRDIIGDGELLECYKTESVDGISIIPNFKYVNRNNLKFEPIDMMSKRFSKYCLLNNISNIDLLVIDYYGMESIVINTIDNIVINTIIINMGIAGSREYEENLEKIKYSDYDYKFYNEYLILKKKTIKTLPNIVTVDNDKCINILTSISPKYSIGQDLAIQSWQKLNVNIYSLNTIDEINILNKLYANINFVEVDINNTEYNITNKPLVRINEFINFTKKFKLDTIFALINSDIILNIDNNYINWVHKNINIDDIFYFNRINFKETYYDLNDRYMYGIDMIIFKNDNIPYCYPENYFCIGMPWWDYWILYHPIINNKNIYYITDDVCFHKNHDINWNQDLWKKYGSLYYNDINNKYKNFTNIDYNIIDQTGGHFIKNQLHPIHKCLSAQLTLTIINGRNCGMFSMFLEVLEAIRTNEYVYINLKNEFPYFCGGNTWDTYFEQPFDININYKYIIKYNSPSGWILDPTTINNKERLLTLNNICNNSIILKENINFIVDTYYNLYINKNIVLAVHIRGTDIQESYDNNHFRSLNIYKKNINDYIKEIDKYLNIIDKIFICTDENNILEIIKKKYGDKVIYYNSIRSYNDKPVHLNNSNDKFKVGQDVIVESVLMSKCEYFLHGTSNVAAAVKIFNPEIKSKNIDII
jgi:hypothetical protein